MSMATARPNESSKQLQQEGPLPLNKTNDLMDEVQSEVSCASTLTSIASSDASTAVPGPEPYVDDCSSAPPDLRVPVRTLQATFPVSHQYREVDELSPVQVAPYGRSYPRITTRMLARQLLMFSRAHMERINRAAEQSRVAPAPAPATATAPAPKTVLSQKVTKLSL